MIKKTYFIVLIVYLTLSSACATMEHGRTQDLNITTYPSEAEVSIDNSINLRTPSKVILERIKDHNVVIRKEGYEDRVISIERKFSTSALRNCLLIYFFPFAIFYDFNTGGIWDLDPDNISTNLIKVHSPSSPITAAAPVPTPQKKISILSREDLLIKIQYGKQLYLDGKYKEAINELQRLISADIIIKISRKEIYDIHFYLALSHMVMEDNPDNTRREFLRAIQLIPDNNIDNEIYSPKVVDLYNDIKIKFESDRYENEKRILMERK